MNSVSQMEVGDVLFGVLGMTMSIYRNLFHFQSNLFLLLVTLSLAFHVKALHVLIAPRPNSGSGLLPLNELSINFPVDMILSKYRTLKDLAAMLNSTFGGLMLLYVLTSISTIATYLNTVIVEPDLFTKIRIVWGTNTFVIILVTGSNLCNHVGG